MRTVFADSGYWIALLSPKDDLHSQALSLSKGLGPHLLVTTEMVLAEVAAFFSARGDRLRAAAAKLICEVRNSPNTSVIPQTSLQFQNALALYEQVSDKDWSLVDCASFQVMRELSIMEALAHDQHFEQNGFVALLRS